MVWLPTNSTAKSELSFRFYFILYHCIPAFFIDIILKLKGSNIRLIPVYSKMYVHLNLMSYFSCRSWDFECKNKHEIYKKMSKTDHLDFPCQPNDQELVDMYPNAFSGLIKYFFMETDEDSIEAHKKCKKLKILHYCFLAVVYSIMVFLCYRIFGKFCLGMLPVKI